jgi:hypothetical protein
MRRLVIALSAALILGLSACGGGGYDTKTVNVLEKDTDDFGFSDAAPKTKVGKQGPEKLSPGDGLAFRELLLQGKKQVGELDVSCTVTHGGTFEKARTQCSGTATLPDGQLAIDAAVVFGKDDVAGAIVGGTGDYKGAGGTFTSQNNENAPNKDAFNIQIPKK